MEGECQAPAFYLKDINRYFKRKSDQMANLQFQLIDDIFLIRVVRVKFYEKEMRVRKTIYGLILAGALLLPAGIQAEEQAAPGAPLINPAGNPVDQFTGEYWVKSTPENKEAYLFGIDSAIAVEATIARDMAAKAAKSGKKPGSMLSPFERGWMEAFKDMTRKEIVAAVDKWYTEHPEELNRPVLSVIWFEVIEPRLDMIRKGAKS